MLKRDLKIAIAAIICASLIYLLWSRFNKKDLAEEFPLPASQRRHAKVQALAPSTTPPSLPIQAQPVAATPAPASPAKEYINQQDALIKKFKKLVRLEVLLPRTFQFVELNMEEGIAAIYGREGAGREMSVLATARTGPVEEVIAFINELAPHFPLLGNKTFDTNATTKIFEAPKDSGIDPIIVIAGPENKNAQVYAAYLKRSDGKGSYLFLMKAAEGYFDKNEGEFENMINSLKALPE